MRLLESMALSPPCANRCSGSYLNFNTTTNFTVSGYGYATFVVQVPVQQIAWQVNLTPSSGDASVAIRQNSVPNEFVNDAFSEVPAPASDGLSKEVVT